MDESLRVARTRISFSGSYIREHPAVAWAIGSDMSWMNGRLNCTRS